MKVDPTPPTAEPATLQDVLDRLGGDGSRRRDLRSAITSYAKLAGQRPSAIPLDLAEIRQTLDAMAAAQARMSPKRWANLRSDLAGAIDASGLLPMLKTKDIELDSGQLTAAFVPTAGEHSENQFGTWLAHAVDCVALSGVARGRP